MEDLENRKELVRKHLLIDEDATFRTTVPKAAKVLKIDEGGRFHAQVDLEKYGTRQKIEWFLLGRYLGHFGGLADTDSAADKEIAKFFGLKIPEVQKRAHDLRVSGILEPVAPGTYRLTEARLNEVLRELGAE